MLIDFPKVKSEISEIIMGVFEKNMETELGFINEIGKTFQHEGNRGSYATVDGEVKDKSYEKMEVEFSIEYKNIPDMEPQDVFKIAAEHGQNMGTKMGQYFFSTINKTLDDTGNVVEAHGKPMSLELFYEVLEKMEIPFDKEGNPIMPTVVVSPKDMPTIKAEIEKEKIEKKFEKRHQEIIERKRKEWNEKQNNRKLVE